MKKVLCVWNSPRGAQRSIFFEALYRLADDIKGLIYWPGVAPSSVITEAATLRHIPEEFVEGCGPPIVVKNGDEITEAIRNS